MKLAKTFGEVKKIKQVKEIPQIILYSSSTKKKNMKKALIDMKDEGKIVERTTIEENGIDIMEEVGEEGVEIKCSLRPKSIQNSRTPQ